MRTIEISTYLEADPEIVCQHVMRPQLLNYVTKGIIKFKPISPDIFPETWQPQKYRTGLYFLGFIPIGWQSIGIELQPMQGNVWSLRDNGHSAMIKSWDHIIEVSPEGNGVRYTDRVSIDAGLLTSIVAIFAKYFYKHRQKRWRRLVANGFDYDR